MELKIVKIRKVVDIAIEDAKRQNNTVASELLERIEGDSLEDMDFSHLNMEAKIIFQLALIDYVKDL